MNTFSASWSTRLPAYVELMRLDRPVGIYLLLWPTLWALWCAADGLPPWPVLLIFVAGVAIMRSAGCVINDYADRHVDAHVARTKQRPMADGRVSEKEALILFAGLCAFAFALVLMTNLNTIMLSVGGLALAAIYPFMKRYTHFPQVVLGAAFSWAIPMAYAAVTEATPALCWLLFLANLTWTVAYDTIYALMDREDDVKIGVKSTAIFFGEADLAMIATLQGITLLILVLAAGHLQAGPIYFLGLLTAAALFFYQYRLIRHREPAACLQAFKNNNVVGLVIFAAIALDLAVNRAPL